jgi:CheY-like chemotaxis protein
MVDTQTNRPAILVVDDDPDVCRMLQAMLRRIVPDHTILGAENGAQALDIIATHPVRLVITDYLMPEMNGSELTAAIKESWPAIGVVLITGMVTITIEHLAEGGQFNSYLRKPLTRDDLARAVHALLE